MKSVIGITINISQQTNVTLFVSLKSGSTKCVVKVIHCGKSKQSSKREKKQRKMM
jgi:hypothetical protein